MTEVNLLDFLKGNCDKVGCIYNDSGFCGCSDKQFLSDRLEDVMDCVGSGELGVNDSMGCYVFNCQCAYSEGVCINCGSDLHISEDVYPYGDSTVSIKSSLCMNCD